MAQEIQISRLQELTSQADASRKALGEAAGDIREASNLAKRFKTSVNNNMTTWLSSAAFIGWVLSKLPARKKTVYKVKGSDSEKVATKAASAAGKSGIMVALLGLLFQSVRPVLQKIVLEYVRGQAEKRFDARKTPVKSVG